MTEQDVMRWKLSARVRGEVFRPIMFASLVVGLAFAITAAIVALMGINPGRAYLALVRGALGSAQGVSETLVKAAPLMLTGAAYGFAARAGAYNIGGEGQLYVGALFATAGALVPLPGPLPLIVSLAAGFAGGFAWGGLAGLLKARLGTDEIISTIMLNYVGMYLVSFMVRGPIREPPGYLPQSPPIPAGAYLPGILPGTRLHLGVLLAVLVLAGVYFLVWLTAYGFELRTCGLNPNAARVYGVNVKARLWQALAVAGGLAGLAGANEILGLQHRLLENVSPGYGFDGIAVSLLGGNHPLGIFFASLLFGALRSGANEMQRSAGVPATVVYVIQALIILAVISRGAFELVAGRCKLQMR